ncbi:hypothetical protein ACLMJK_000636 [Lecanora helva]
MIGDVVGVRKPGVTYPRSDLASFASIENAVHIVMATCLSVIAGTTAKGNSTEIKIPDASMKTGKTGVANAGRLGFMNPTGYSTVGGSLSLSDRLPAEAFLLSHILDIWKTIAYSRKSLRLSICLEY